MWDDLVCPFDQGSLDCSGQWLSCRDCGRGYPVLDSIPTFLPDSDSDDWRRTQEERARRLPRTARRSGNTALRHRAHQLEPFLGEFVSLNAHAKVLQMGVPGEGEVHYFAASVRYAVEPLAGLMADRGCLRFGPVRWVNGGFEQLPFPSANFQAVLLGNALWHAASPLDVLREAARCVAADGVIWLSSAVRSSSLWQRMGHWIRRWDRLPDGPPWYFSEPQLRKLFQRAGLKLCWEGWDSGESWLLRNTCRRLPRGQRSVRCFVLQPTAQPVRVEQPSVERVAVSR